MAALGRLPTPATGLEPDVDPTVCKQPAPASAKGGERSIAHAWD